MKIRDKEIRTQLTHTTLSGNRIRKVALPQFEDHGEILKWLLLDNVPGSFPYSAVTPSSLKRLAIVPKTGI